MEAFLALIIFVIFGGVLLGAVFGWIAFFGNQSSKKRLNNIESHLKSLQLHLDNLIEKQSEKQSEKQTENDLNSKELDKTANQLQELKELKELKENLKISDIQKPEPTLDINQKTSEAKQSKVDSTQKESTEPVKPINKRVENLSEPNAVDKAIKWMLVNWMVSIGGLSVAIAGVFLVKYSMEQGYLSPVFRIVFSIMSGVLLHAFAFYWFKKSKSLYPAMSALAGAGSITIYAALLAGLHFYEMFPSLLVFSILAILSLITMSLALIYGPILAIMGIVGAMAVPLLVGSDSGGGVNDILIYILVVCASAQFLIKKVQRNWLHIIVLTGAMIWWALTFEYLNESIRSIYLTALLYIFVAIRFNNYALMKPFLQVEDNKKELELGLINQLTFGFNQHYQTLITFLIIFTAQCLTMIIYPQWVIAPMLWLPMLVIFLFIYRANSILRIVPWLIFISYLVSISIAALFSNNSDSSHIIVLLLSISLLVSLTLILNRPNLIKRFDPLMKIEDALQSALLTFAPLFSVSLIYWFFNDQIQIFNWAVFTLLFGLSLLGAALYQMQKNKVSYLNIWAIIASHFAFSLTFVMCFEQFYLTLALSAQVISLVWMFKRYELNHISILVKLLLAIIVTRLTFNPWLAQYDDAIHWTLYTYGFSVILILFASRLCVETKLRQWLEAAALHIFVLFVNSEMRYWLYDGEVFSQQFSFLEVNMNLLLFGGLSCVYQIRSKLSQSFKWLYEIASKVLMVLSFVAFFILVLPLNPLWNVDDISTRPIFNGLMLAYGLPIILWLIMSRLFDKQFKQGFEALSGITLFIYVSLNIHHLFNVQIQLVSDISNAEQYTYSVVWLLMAVVLFIWSVIKQKTNIYKASVGLMLLVIAKIFLLDMSGLVGVLRILSFLGLGLSLLALATLHQWLKKQTQQNLEEK